MLRDRQRDERDDRDPGEDAEHRDQHEVDRLRHVVARVARLLGHVRDRLDAGVGDHRDRQREDQLLVAGRRAQVDLVDEHRRVEDQDRAEHDQQHLGDQVGDRQEDVQPGRLAQPADVQRREQGDDDDAADDVAGVVPQRREERAQVVGHEERADRDRDDVVERQRPAGEERRDLVERVPRERGRAAGLGEHRGALRVRLGRQREQAAREDEHQRREPERVRGDQPERVVDRRADVPVGGREQAGHPDRAAQAALDYSRHRAPVRGRSATHSTLGGVPSRLRQERGGRRRDFAKKPSKTSRAGGSRRPGPSRAVAAATGRPRSWRGCGRRGRAGSGSRRRTRVPTPPAAAGGG